MAGVPEHLARTILDLVKRYLRDEYKIDLSRQVRGTLPIDYGGTGSSSGAAGPPGPTGPPGPAGPPGLAGPLDTLTDVTIASPIAGQVLRKSGGDWVNAQLSFADLGSTPTTLAGYGITDAYSKTASDARYAPLVHAQAWSTITGTPTTLGGYGITDAVTLATAQTIAGVKTFSTAPVFPVTAGSVLFAGAGGVLTENNAQLFWDDTNRRLGIGTATPAEKLNIVSNTAAVLSFDAYGITSAQRLQFRRGYGTAASPLPMTGNGVTIAGYSAQAYGNAGFVQSGVVSFVTDGTPAGDDIPTRWVLFLHRAGGVAGSTPEVLRVTNAGWLGLGIAGPQSRLHVVEADAVAVGSTAVVTLTRNMPGTPADGFGSRVDFLVKTSASDNVRAADLTVAWATALHASRKARVTVNVYDQNNVAREALRMEASATAPMIGFLGAAATARQAITGSKAGNVALTNLLTELAAKGLITDSTT